MAKPKFKTIKKGQHTHVRFTYPKSEFYPKGEQKIMTRDVHEGTYLKEGKNVDKIEYLVEIIVKKPK